ncbi:MAG TPA: antibiotic biosynthesis monooxygenase [Vicinamibacterales bacterium]
MNRVAVSLVVVALALLGTSVSSRAQGAPASDQAFHAVAYAETMASGGAAAVRALRTYREATLALDGCLRVDVFEQVGRAGHWVLLETWRDQKAFDLRDGAPMRGLAAALAAIRVSGFDQRPYKTVTTAPPRAGALGAAVSVISHVDVAPNPAVAPMLTRLADTSRAEPGNLRFDVLQHTMRGNHFTVVETWRDQMALDAHVAAAHTKQYRDDILPMTGSPLDERLFKAVP